MIYYYEFLEALARTARFDLSIPPDTIEPNLKPLMNDKRIRHINRVLAPAFEGITSYTQIAGQCMPIHLKARPILEAWLGCPVYFTLGWIDDGSERGLHKFDEEFIADKLKNGHQESTINIHAWLTLPTMEVIDLTLCTTFSILQNRKEGEGMVITKKADDMKGFSYKPMLVGEEFIAKIGVLQQISWFDLE